MERIISTLKDTLEKSFLIDLKKYILQHDEVHDFAIYSDYCIDANEKFNNVISFTLAPTWTTSSELIDLISQKIPRDIKKTKNIDKDIIEVLTNRLFFHVTFILKNTSGLLYSPSHSEKEIAIMGMESIIEMIKMWIPNQPEGKDKFEKQIKRFSLAKNELTKKSAPLQLFRLIGIVAMLASYLAYLISREKNIKTITWFSDRDKIIESFHKICFDMFEINHYALCLPEIEEINIPKIGFGVDTCGENGLWFDSLIRIPDYLAGTIASWKLDENFIPKKKHFDILYNVFAENQFCTLINVNIAKNEFSFGRHTVAKVN